MSGVADLRVLFAGDSFTAGVLDPDGLGWVGRVVAASFAAGIELTAWSIPARAATPRSRGSSSPAAGLTGCAD